MTEKRLCIFCGRAIRKRVDAAGNYVHVSTSLGDAHKKCWNGATFSQRLDKLEYIKDAKDAKDEPRTWTRTADELPPEDVPVMTFYWGFERILVRRGKRWFRDKALEAREPEYWRKLSDESIKPV